MGSAAKLTLDPFRQETPKLAEWYEGRLYHMIASGRNALSNKPVCSGVSLPLPNWCT